MATNTAADRTRRDTTKTVAAADSGGQGRQRRTGNPVAEGGRSEKIGSGGRTAETDMIS